MSAATADTRTGAETPSTDPAGTGGQHVALYLGTAGGVLGVVAGLTQALVGSRIPEWTGAKSEPLALGLLTVALSAGAAAGAATLSSGPPPAERRTALACGMLLPAALCFSTVGRLWFLPGTLLLSAIGILLGTGARGDLRRVAAQYWAHALLAVLGGLQLLMAVAAAPALLLLVGVAGGLAVLVACGSRHLRTRLLLVAAGTVPFAALTWTSLATPLLAIVALGLAAGLVPPRRSGQVAGATPRQ